MADNELRRLERRWRSSGDPADEAAWLVARLRAGELPAARLELAALVGHEPAARAALEADAGAPVRWVFDPHSRERILDGRWLIGELWTRSREAAVRFGRAIARNRLGAGGGPARDPLLAAIGAAEAWALCPCAEHAGAAARQAETVWERLRTSAWQELGPELLAAAFAAAVTAQATAGEEPRYLRNLLSHEAPGDLERARAEVIAWALGSEPLSTPDR